MSRNWQWLLVLLFLWAGLENIVPSKSEEVSKLITPAAPPTNNSIVPDLTAQEIESAMKKNTIVLLKLYKKHFPMPSDVHGVFEDAVKQLQTRKSDMLIGQIDVMMNAEFIQQFTVATVPSVLFIRDKQHHFDYYSSMEVEALLQWVDLRLHGATQQLDSAEAAQALMDRHNVTVIGCFNNIHSESAELFKSTVEYIDEVAYGITDNAEVIQHLRCTANSLVLFKTIEEKRVDFPSDQELTEMNMGVFIMTHMQPNVLYSVFPSSHRYVHVNIQFRMLLIISEKDAQFAELMDAYKVVARKFKGQVLFYWVNTDDKRSHEILPNLGLTPADGPLLRAVKYDNELHMIKYRPDSSKAALNEAFIEEFCQAMLADTVPQYFRSEARPENWNATPVKYIVSDDFREIVFDKSKTVLLYFWAPWCTDCNSTVTNILQPLAEELSQDSSILIGQSNYRENEYDGLEDARFPALVLFLKESNTQIRYKGNETLSESIRNFFFSSGSINPPLYEENPSSTPAPPSEPSRDEL